MEDQSPRRRPLGLLIAIVAIALTAGSATALFTWRSLSPSLPNADFPEIEIEGETIPEGYEAPTSESINVPDPPNSDVAVTPAQRQGTIYWVNMEGTEVALAPVDIPLPDEGAATERLNVAFANLMTGPQENNLEAATTIPEDTELLALNVEEDGVHVNLSEAFTFGGGSASMIGRLSQVVYTATTLEPEAAVWLSVEGTPLTLLGGEGLIIRQPITRNDLTTDFGVQQPAVN
ncbi:MAG: GerMN domain-containing protein [Cyanobacteria bacterium P01_H01_bin.58]